MLLSPQQLSSASARRVYLPDTSDTSQSMSRWSWFWTVIVSLLAVTVGFNTTAILTDLSKVVGQSLGQCHKFAQKVLAPAEATPSQQLSQYAYQKTILAKHFPPEVVSQMKMVGMREFKAIQRMVVPKHTVKEKVDKGLTAKGLPHQVAEAVSFELDEARKVATHWDDFKVDDTGSAHVYRVVARMMCDDEECDLAIAAFGSSFNAAQEISHYEEQQYFGHYCETFLPVFGEWFGVTECSNHGFQDKVTLERKSMFFGVNLRQPRTPEYDYKERVITEFEDGYFGRYEKTRTVRDRVQIGTRVNKIPIMKQKTFTAETFEQVKDYLENKAMKDFLQMAPPPPQTEI